VVVGIAAVIVGLTLIIVADTGYHGPTGLPPMALALYLLGAMALRAGRARLIG